MNIIPLLLFIGLVIAIWHNELRYREQAYRLATRLCAEQEVQLLDETIARLKTRLVWRTRSLAIERVYRFEFSRDGDERSSGHFAFRGRETLWADFEEERIWFH